MKNDVQNDKHVHLLTETMDHCMFSEGVKNQAASEGQNQHLVGVLVLLMGLSEPLSLREVSMSFVKSRRSNFKNVCFHALCIFFLFEKHTIHRQMSCTACEAGEGS